MKTVRKLFTLALLLAFIVGNTAHVIAEWDPISVQNLNVENTKNIKVLLDNEVDVDSISSTELKLMHDIRIATAELDITDAKKAVLNLDSELISNTTYNLISITGVDGSMDFQTSDNLEWEELLNTIDEGIQSITIIDPMNIEVMYYEAISSNEIELKLLRDLPVEDIIENSDIEFTVVTSEKLKTKSNYIFMLLAAKNIDGSEAEIENGIFNFDTPSSLDEASGSEEIELNAAEEEEEQEEVEEEVVEEVVEEEIVEEEAEVVEEPKEEKNEITVTTKTAVTGVAKTGLEDDEGAGEENVKTEEVANEEVKVETDKITKAGSTGTGSNVEAVAGEATEVPETWTTTNVLIVLTLISAMGIQMRRRKK